MQSDLVENLACYVAADCFVNMDNVTAFATMRE
jgi:hypothetical protein